MNNFLPAYSLCFPPGNHLLSAQGRGVFDTTLCDKVCLNDLRLIGSFLLVLRFPPPIQLIATI